uniref:Uncharacterized protein n=1 Tax=Desertifilum tharense IPPAS B-1220 TaxID=1781255 RepID=A0ACD5GYM8_9CYAN
MTPQTHPELWAATQNSLGIAYSQRLQKDRAQNLESAIAAFQQALQIYTPEAFPHD